MASLHFDGATNRVRGTGHGATLDGATSIASLFRRTGDTSHYEAWFGGATSGNAMSVMLAYDQQSLGVAEKITVWDGSINRYPASTTTPTSNTDWWIIAVTKAAGAAVARIHMKNLTTNAAWVHEDCVGGTNTYPAMTGGYLNVGNYSTSPGNPGNLNEGIVADIALTAWWPRVMSDAQVEGLSADRTTSDWWQSKVGIPSSLTEFTSTSPVDIAALETWTVTGATATGADPPGWQYDQKGSGARYFKLTSGSETTLTTQDGLGRPIAYTVNTATPTAFSLADAEIARETWGYMLTEVAAP